MSGNYKIKISIIIPVFNAEKNLNKLLDSLIEQSFKSFEVIIIDDGSTDNSPQICDDYSLRYNQIICVHQKNQGVSAARNLGLKMATGNYIAFVDSDDNIGKDYLKNLIQKISYGDKEIIIGGYRIIHHNFSLDEKRFLPDNVLSTDNLDCEFLAEALKLGLLNSTWGKLFSIESIKNISYDDEMSYGEDTKFLLNSIEKSEKIIFSSECDYTYICDNGLSVAKTYDKIYSINKYFDTLYLFENRKSLSGDSWEKTLSSKIANEIFVILDYAIFTYKIKEVFKIIDILLSNLRTSYLVKLFFQNNNRYFRYLKIFSAKDILKIYVFFKNASKKHK